MKWKRLGRALRWLDRGLCWVGFRIHDLSGWVDGSTKEFEERKAVKQKIWDEEMKKAIVEHGVGDGSLHIINGNGDSREVVTLTPEDLVGGGHDGD